MLLFEVAPIPIPPLCKGYAAAGRQGRRTLSPDNCPFCGLFLLPPRPASGRLLAEVTNPCKERRDCGQKCTPSAAPGFDGLAQSTERPHHLSIGPQRALVVMALGRCSCGTSLRLIVGLEGNLYRGGHYGSEGKREHKPLPLHTCMMCGTKKSGAGGGETCFLSSLFTVRREGAKKVHIFFCPLDGRPGRIRRNPLSRGRRLSPLSNLKNRPEDSLLTPLAAEGFLQYAG